MSEPTEETYLFPPVKPPEPGAERCTSCVNGELSNGSSSYVRQPDGSIRISHRRGSKCPRCAGTGWIVVRPAKQRFLGE